MNKIYDCVVVGAGISGLAAGLFLGRAGRSTRIYDGGRQTIMSVETVREYLGFDGMSPSSLLERAREEVLRYGVEIQQEKVSEIRPLDNGWFEVVSSEAIITARTLVLATGETYVLPAISGIPDAWGKDLRVCPCFDGYEVRDGKYVVFGLGERLAHMASWVSMWSDDITVVSTRIFTDDEAERLSLLGIKRVHDDITGLIHDEGKLTGVTTQSATVIPCDATWVALDANAASDLAATLCEVDEKGFAITDPSGATSRPGVYAIGNASQPWDHLAHAAAAGTRVGPVVTFYLLEQKIAEIRANRNPEGGVVK